MSGANSIVTTLIRILRLPAASFRGWRLEGLLNADPYDLSQLNALVYEARSLSQILELA